MVRACVIHSALRHKRESFFPPHTSKFFQNWLRECLCSRRCGLHWVRPGRNLCGYWEVRAVCLCFGVGVGRSSFSARVGSLLGGFPQERYPTVQDSGVGKAVGVCLALGGISIPPYGTCFFFTDCIHVQTRACFEIAFF